MEKYHTEVNGKALHSHPSWERLAKSGGQELKGTVNGKHGKNWRGRSLL